MMTAVFRAGFLFPIELNTVVANRHFRVTAGAGDLVPGGLAAMGAQFVASGGLKILIDRHSVVKNKTLPFKFLVGKLL